MNEINRGSEISFLLPRFVLSVLLECGLLHKFAVAAAGYGLAIVLRNLVSLVVAIATFIEHDFSIALEGKYMCADAVEEPAVVADNDGASGEVFETFLERTQGVYIDVVGGLVE